MTIQKIDFLRTAYGSTFRRRIYISDGCEFKVVNSTAASPMILTTEEPHCLSNGDEIVLCLGHAEETTKKFNYDTAYAVTVISPDQFSIPYDNTDCTRVLVGTGHKPLDLTSSTYSANLYATGEDHTAGGKATLENGSTVAKILTYKETYDKIEEGGTFTAGGFSAKILGKGRDNDDCDSGEYYLVLDTPSSISAENTFWSASYPDTSERGNLLLNPMVTKDNTLGYVEMSYDTTATDFTGLYHYQIIESIGAESGIVYHGIITYGQESSDVNSSVACTAPFPVVVVNPDAVSNSLIGVATIAALGSLDSATLTGGTVRVVLGRTVSTDGRSLAYRLEQVNGRTTNGEARIPLEQDGPCF